MILARPPENPFREAPSDVPGTTTGTSEGASARERGRSPARPIGGMSDQSVTKVSSSGNPAGKMGQEYLASGVHVSLRKWVEEPPSEPKEPSARDYETVGYVLAGKAELHVGENVVTLEPGDSWVVNRGESHTYRILEPFTAIEATAPPAQVHGRDE